MLSDPSIDRIDPNFMSSFLRTHKLYMTSMELYKLLSERFTEQPPAGFSNEETQLWKDKKQTPIRLQ